MKQDSDVLKYKLIERITDENHYRSLGIGIRECGKEACAGDKVVVHKDYEKNNFVILHYVYSGEGYIEHNGDRRAVAKGDMFFLPVIKKDFRYFADKSNPFEYRWINLMGRMAVDIMAELGFDENNFVRHVGNDKVAELFAEITDDYFALGPDSYRVIGKLFLLFAELKNVREADLSLRYVRNVMLYVGYNYPDSEMRTGIIAANEGISEGHLRRMFLAVTGKSLKQYIIKVRMENAKNLFREGEKRGTAVAKACGYRDRLYFSKAFKEYTGVSPSDFVRSLRQ